MRRSCGFPPRGSSGGGLTVGTRPLSMSADETNLCSPNRKHPAETLILKPKPKLKTPIFKPLPSPSAAGLGTHAGPHGPGHATLSAWGDASKLGFPLRVFGLKRNFQPEYGVTRLRTTSASCLTSFSKTAIEKSGFPCRAHCAPVSLYLFASLVLVHTSGS